MASGSVVIKASTANRLIPVGEATVFIVQRDENGGDILIATRTTGESGETGKINIETPEKSLSTSPGNDKGFTSVNIRVEHPGYYTNYITGAQIFADTESIQNVVLIPLAIPSDKITERVEIIPQTL